MRSPTAGNRGQGSKWLRASTRRRIYKRDGHRCVWCQAKVTPKGLPEDFAMGVAATVDHVVPRSRGGTNAASNLITCCSACNARRGDKSVPAFARLLQAEDNHAGRLARFIMQRVRAAQRRKLPKVIHATKTQRAPAAVGSDGALLRMQGHGDVRRAEGRQRPPDFLSHDAAV